MSQIITKFAGPLDPDPFLLDGSQPLDLGPTVHLYLDPNGYPFPFRPRRRRGALYRPIESSVAVIAHIPPGALPIPYAAFQDDGVTAQHEWLSQAYLSNRFRLVHGLRVRGFADPAYGFDSAVPDGRLLGRANPSTFRFLPFVKFRAPVQHATYMAPWRTPAPAGPPDQEVLAFGSDMRAMNGFLANPIGRLAWRLQQVAAKAIDSERRDEIPQIGATLQLWLAQDGCKCFAFAHNHFPQYTFYLDGMQLDWNSPLNFRSFSGYNVDVQWRPFLAFLLYDALRPFPLRDRYPGACGVGWYRSISPDGRIEWCDRQPPAEIISFAPLEAAGNDFVQVWWDRLEQYVRVFVVMREEHRRDEQAYPWWGEARQLDEIWASLGIRSRRVSIRQDG